MPEGRLLEILRGAMEVERDGFQFYSMAADRSEDPGAAEMFVRLAAEEQKHYEALQSQQRALLETGLWDPDVVLDDAHTLEPLPEVFSEGFRKRIKGKHLEMSALSIGILLEKNAIDFYSQSAEQANEADVADFFRSLADWETGHYQMLLRLDEDLKEEYWNENRFSPLL